MRNKLIAFFLPLVFAAKAFSAPANSSCDWVDQEALAEFGLANSVPKVAPQGTGIPKDGVCIFATPGAEIPSLIVSVVPTNGGLEFKPLCTWSVPENSNVELGLCYMSVVHASISLTLMTAPSSASTIQSTLRAQAERLFNKYLESAPK